MGDILRNNPVVSMNDENHLVDQVVAHLGRRPSVYAEIRLLSLGQLAVAAEEAGTLEAGRNEGALSQ